MESQSGTKENLQVALNRALGGGVCGATAMVAQVGSLMWLRTTMNYQYRHGTGTREALQTLYRQGGVPRLYRGLGPALLQGPLSRFGDTAMNTGVMSFLNQEPITRELPIGVKTGFASSGAALWRIGLMPLDTVKTMMQVEGTQGLPLLRTKLRHGGPRVLFHGSMAASGATFVGHYPWFLVYNVLGQRIPEQTGLWPTLCRNATIGFCSSVVSDGCSNSLRVIKTTKQSYGVAISYPEVLREIVHKEGYQGVMTRGLKTRILANGLQGMMFTIIFKGLQKKWEATG